MADVELQEQSVPLKNAEQGTTVEGAESAVGGNGPEGQPGGEAVPGQKKEKKSWFTSKRTKKETIVVSSEKAPAENDADGEGQNNVNEKQKSGGGAKKCPFNFCRPQKCAASGEGEQQQQQGDNENQPTFQYNMVQRDDRKLQEAIDLGVDQIFGEPDAVHSLNGVWKTTNSVFIAVRNFIYKLLSLVFAIPLAIVFGVLFAVVSVLSVYVFVPVGRLLSVPFGWLAKVWSVVVSAVLDPICRSCGLFWGNVRVSQYGINQDPTAVITA